MTPLTPFSDALAEEVHHSLAIDTGYDGHVLITTTSMPDFVVSYTIPDRLSVWNMRSGDKVGTCLPWMHNIIHILNLVSALRVSFSDTGPGTVW